MGVLRLMGQSWHGHRDVAIIWQDEGTRYVLHNLTCVNVATNTIRIGEIKSCKKRLTLFLSGCPDTEQKQCSI